jgi:hypothetical protein
MPKPKSRSFSPTYQGSGQATEKRKIDYLDYGAMGALRRFSSQVLSYIGKTARPAPTYNPMALQYGRPPAYPGTYNQLPTQAVNPTAPAGTPRYPGTYRLDAQRFPAVSNYNIVPYMRRSDQPYGMAAQYANPYYQGQPQARKQMEKRFEDRTYYPPVFEQGIGVLPYQGPPPPPIPEGYAEPVYPTYDYGGGGGGGIYYGSSGGGSYSYPAPSYGQPPPPTFRQGYGARANVQRPSPERISNWYRSLVTWTGV